MATAVALEEEDTIAIINDDPDEIDVWNLLVKEAGFHPVPIPRPHGGPYTDIGTLVDRVESAAKWAICDHRLSRGNLAQFFGAQAVAELNRRKHTPALLVTEYDKIDADVSIRLYRERIPVLVPAQRFDQPEVVAVSLKTCAAEILQGEIPIHRRPWRTLVEISNRTTESDQEVLDALIPAWNPRVQIRFPLELITEELRASAQPEARFFAQVNIGAENEEDLFLFGFEPTPEPLTEGFVA